MSSHLESVYPELFSGNSTTLDNKTMKNGAFGYLLITFVIVTVIVWFILFALQPSFIVVHDDEHKHPQVEQGKALLISVVLGIILTFIIYMLLLRC